jgi:hypothetical protein
VTQDEPERGVGVQPVGEVRVIREADQVQPVTVGLGGVLEQGIDGAGAGLQPEAEQHLAVVVCGGHQAAPAGCCHGVALRSIFMT